MNRRQQLVSAAEMWHRSELSWRSALTTTTSWSEICPSPFEEGMSLGIAAVTNETGFLKVRFSKSRLLSVFIPPYE